MAAGSGPSPTLGGVTSRPQTLNRDILRLAVPALGALIAEPMFLIVDSALVGHLGVEPLAGLGIASAVLQTIVGLMVFLAYSTTPAVARRFGAGDPTPRGVGGDRRHVARARHRRGPGVRRLVRDALPREPLRRDADRVGTGRDLPRHLDVGPPRHAHRVRGDGPAARHAGHGDPAVDRRTRLRRQRPAQLALHLRRRLGHRRFGLRHRARAVGHGRGLRDRGRPAGAPARGIRPSAARRRARLGEIGWLALPAHRLTAGRAARDGGRRHRARHR
jgi:hypothetical protein